tara:strand:- start:84 stop:293 length:210 start_codon:yes stop_codon:yes gene_type:complete
MDMIAFILSFCAGLSLGLYIAAQITKTKEKERVRELIKLDHALREYKEVTDELRRNFNNSQRPDKFEIN